MTLPKQKQREILFLLLYCLDHSHAREEDLIPFISAELKVAKSYVREALKEITAIQAKIPEIDAKIAHETKSYDFSRIHSVEKSILRLGAYELYFDKELPPKVAIAEAIRLSKKFGTPASVSFVNAVLDHLYQISLGETGNSEEVEKALNEYRDGEEVS